MISGIIFIVFVLYRLEPSTGWWIAMALGLLVDMAAEAEKKS